MTTPAPRTDGDGVSNRRTVCLPRKSSTEAELAASRNLQKHTMRVGPA